MTPMESQGWRKKSTVTVLYSYSYPSSSSTQDEVSMREGERLILLEKSNTDWWQVRRPGDKSQPFYAPANYLQEDGISKAKKAASASMARGSTEANACTNNVISPVQQNRRSGDAQHMMESRSDDCLQSPPANKAVDKWSMRVANSELRKQRSTSMDAIMFLELLENEIRDMPLSGASKSLNGQNKGGSNKNDNSIQRQIKAESLVDRFKKPRISKDLWERRKSWAVEELTPAPLLLAHSPRHPPLTEETFNPDRRSIQPLLSTNAAPPLPPRLTTSESPAQPTPPMRRDKIVERNDDDDAVTTTVAKSDKNVDKAPALPPKKNPNQGVVASSTSSRMVENYSRVIPLRSGCASRVDGGGVVKSIVVGGGGNNNNGASPSLNNRRLSDSLEKLAQQIQTPLSYPHPIPPPRRTPTDSMASNSAAGSSSSSPPQLPPKVSIAKQQQQPVVAKPTSTPIKVSEPAKKEAKDNYVNLTRPLTVVDLVDDIQSDESGINMSFNNPLFSEKEDGQEKDSQEQLGSSVDLESSIDETVSLKAAKSRGSGSNLSGSELEANYASSNEDILSSKDSLNSIPSVKSDRSRSQKNTGSLTKPPPDSPGPRQRPRRELFENWCEYVDQTSGRPFYYNSENRAKSWKPPRRIGNSPITRGISIEEEKFDDAVGGYEADGLSSSADSSHSRLAVESVREAARNSTVPPGWTELIDPYTEEVVYVNSRTGARWYTSSDSEGRIYFYEEDSNESLWALPVVSPLPIVVPETEPQGIQQGVFYPEGSKLSPKMNEPPPVIVVPTSKWDLVRQRTSKVERNVKTRSMVLTNFSGCVEDIAVESGEIPTRVTMMMTPSKTASLPRNIQPQWPNLQGGSIVSDYLTNLDIRVLQQGVLQKTKLTENGKKIRKNWTSSWVVLTDLFLFLFKESTTKMSATAGAATGANKPELCVDLNGATIEWAAVKSSRKGVFQVSTLLGVQLLLQDEDETNAVVWFNEIKRAIQRLPCGTGTREMALAINQFPSPHPSPLTGSKPKKLSLEKNFTPENKHNKSNNESNFLTPPSPDGPASNSGSLLKQGSRKSRLGRSKSTKVPFLGSTDDLTAATATPVERQIKLRDKLRKFFVRRPTVDSLVKKGIWKDEPVFGCLLSALCNADESTVPKFVQQVIQLIESKQENMKADGIYRASGNLSQIQKIRCQVDQYNWAILEIEDDVHVLTGCLKLFFRELKEPLIPCLLFERALQVTNYQGPNSERIRRYREIIESLPTENYDTLQYLLRHLLKITEYREHNRMHISNLAIVFGPTLMWAATVSNNLALDMMQQNLVVEALLNNYHSIFNR